MKRSTERILTTHVGSLPRPDDLRAMIHEKQQGGRSTRRAFAARVESAVAEIVRRQADAGIDIVADGEMGRVGFIPYVNERLTGIEPSPRRDRQLLERVARVQGVPGILRLGGGAAGHRRADRPHPLDVHRARSPTGPAARSPPTSPT